MQFQRAGLKPGKLSRIFISHFHGDHFYGLIGLLTSLQMGGRQKALNIYGPEGTRQYLEFMQQISQFTFEYEVIVHEMKEKSDEIVWDMGEYDVRARPLRHRIFVLGFRVEEKPKPGKFKVEEAEKLCIPDGPLRRRLQEGESVVLPNGTEIHPSQVLGPKRPGKIIAYCLDTGPCENAIELARGADLLIHEGTFDESQTEWAETTGHSTVVQAATIAREAGVKKLILTHISARYKEADEQLLLTQAQKIFPNTMIGRDLMRIEV
jgi:ribonuclease Z